MVAFVMLIQLGLLSLVMALTAAVRADAVFTPVMAEDVQAQACATLLAAGFKDQLLLPVEDDFDTRVDSWWSADSRLTPSCIVQPKSAPDVSNIIQILRYNTTADFAVRSGGHSHWAGGSNIDKGVVIDLGLMRGTFYNQRTTRASILPGGQWADVFKALEPHGVAVPGGRDGNVGIAGFLTGGGNSYYTGRAGFGCDAIVNAEVVLADGRIVNANRQNNPDLLQALKGGSGNFGIVTRFDLGTVPAGSIWGGIRTSNVSQAEIVTRAMVNFTNNNHRNPNAAYLINWTYNPSASNDVVLAQVLIDTAGVEKPPAFEEALQAEAVSDDTAIRPVSDMAETYVLPSGLYNVWFSLTFANDERVIRKAAELHATFVKELLAEIPAKDVGTQNIFQPIPRFFADIGLKKGGNVLGLDRNKDNSLLWLLSCTAKTADQEAILRHKAAAFALVLEKYAKSIGALREWRYLNYVDPSQKHAIVSYGPKNVKFLRKVAAKYDPDGFFQKRRQAGFRLP